ncbi:hypothetical protein SBBP2_1810004 [Burkholderiales bacterium]|nr:hypothetical protein SBBP2_1810004 [Burkholderiales bacterium]
MEGALLERQRQRGGSYAYGGASTSGLCDEMSRAGSIAAMMEET